MSDENLDKSEKHSWKPQTSNDTEMQVHGSSVHSNDRDNLSTVRDGGDSRCETVDVDGICVTHHVGLECPTDILNQVLKEIDEWAYPKGIKVIELKSRIEAIGK